MVAAASSVLLHEFGGIQQTALSARGALHSTVVSGYFSSKTIKIFLTTQKSQNSLPICLFEICRQYWGLLASPLSRLSSRWINDKWGLSSNYPSWADFLNFLASVFTLPLHLWVFSLAWWRNFLPNGGFWSNWVTKVLRLILISLSYSSVLRLGEFTEMLDFGQVEKYLRKENWNFHLPLLIWL